MSHPLPFLSCFHSYNSRRSRSGTYSSCSRSHSHSRSPSPRRHQPSPLLPHLKSKTSHHGNSDSKSGGRHSNSGGSGHKRKRSRSRSRSRTPVKIERDRDRERERERERDRGSYDLSSKKHKHERSSGHRGDRRERSRSYERERERERSHKSKHHGGSGHSGHSRHRRWRTAGESRTDGRRCSFTLRHIWSLLLMLFTACWRRISFCMFKTGQLKTTRWCSPAKHRSSAWVQSWVSYQPESNTTASLALVAYWYTMLKSCYLLEFRSKCDFSFQTISALFCLFCPRKWKAPTLEAFMQPPFHTASACTNVSAEVKYCFVSDAQAHLRLMFGWWSVHFCRFNCCIW